ncbi:TonB-dependent receptor [Leptothrix discophora]|uniref:TonB-dependent receptor n=1 Tax=Leptothrix discophora TaxID=89 RepID=A0ABT9G290_LEPDI|nr:TonB-dependent receptor [Leptothrix discophora]MDP4300599.1 TonB-dependent receptor [Leptothrix discophora]
MSSPSRFCRLTAVSPRLVQLAPIALASFCALGVPRAVMAQADVANRLALASTLPQVVISGTRFADAADSQPIGISVITAEQISRGGYTTLNEAVMRQLGVPGRLDLNGGGEYALDLRGFGGTSDSNMVIVVDGIRVSEGDTGGTRLAGIPIETVERIEVLRGTNAVLYGEGATAGVIVITTKAGKGVSRRDAGQVYLAGGTQGRRELRGTATLNAGDFSFDLAAQRRLSDGHRDNFASGVGAAAFAAQWQDGEGLRLVARHAEDTLSTGLPNALSAAQFAADPSQATSLTDHGRIDGRRSTLTGELRVGAWEFAADVGHRTKALRSINFDAPFDYDIRADTANVRARHIGRIAGLSNQVRFGVDHARWERTVPQAAPDVQRSRAFYIKDDLTLAGGTAWSAGLRREKLDKEAHGFGPGLGKDRVTAWDLGVVQPIGRHAQVYGRLGKSFRLASVDELSNTNLRTQTSRDLEVGTRWRDETTRLEARVYRSRLHNEIGFDPAAGLFGSNVNYDPTRRSGIEAEGRHELSSAVELRAAAALLRSRFDSGANAGKDVPLAPRVNGLVGVNWQFLPQHHLGADVVYIGRQYPTLDNSCRMASAATLDTRYAWRQPSWELSLAVTNVADRTYTTQAFRCDAGQVTGLYPEPGRAIVAAARFNF